MRVKWEAVLTGAAKSSFHWMTTVIGVTCLYSMIYLPTYLHLCESAELEALGSGVACYRLSRTLKLATYLLFINFLHANSFKITE